MGIVIKKRRITSKNKISNKISNSTYDSIQNGGKIEKYKSKTKATTKTKVLSADEKFGKGKSGVKGLARRISSIPKRAYAYVGAIKNTSKHLVSSGLLFVKHRGRTREEHLEHKIQKKGEDFTNKFGSLTHIDGKELKNPYTIVKSIIDSQRVINKQQKAINSKLLNEAAVKKAQEEIMTHKKLIDDETAEKKKLETYANKEGINTKTRDQIFEALQRIETYSANDTKLREAYSANDTKLREGFRGVFRGVFQKSYRNTKSSIEEHGFGKAIKATFTPAVLKRGYEALKEGQYFKSLGIKTTGLGREMWRMPFGKKSTKALTERLTRNTADVKEVARDTKQVLTNIQKMTEDLDRLTGTNAISKAKKETITRKLISQKTLLKALETKSDTMERLMTTTKNLLTEKQKRKNNAIVKYIGKSKDISANLLGSMDAIKTQLGDSNQYNGIQSLLTKISTNPAKNISKDVSNKEVFTAYKDLSTMIDSIDTKMAKIDRIKDPIAYSNLELSRKTVINQGEVIRKLLKRTSTGETTELLLNQTKKMGNLVNSKKRIGANTIMRTTNSSLYTGYAKSLPLFSSNSFAKAKTSKSAVESALKRYKNINLNETPIRYDIQRLFVKDPALKVMYLADPKKFTEIAKLNKNKPEEIRNKYSEEIKLKQLVTQESLDKTENEINKINIAINKIITPKIQEKITEINNLKSELEGIQKKNKTFTDDIENKKTEIDGFTKTITAETEKIKVADGTILQNEKELSNIKLQITKTENTILEKQLKGEPTTDLEKTKQQLDDKENKLNAQITSSKTEKERAKKEVDSKNKAKQAAQIALDEQKKDYENSDEYIKQQELEKEINDSKSKGIREIEKLQLHQEKLLKLQELFQEAQKRFDKKQALLTSDAPVSAETRQKQAEFAQRQKTEKQAELLKKFGIQKLGSLEDFKKKIKGIYKTNNNEEYNNKTIERLYKSFT